MFLSLLVLFCSSVFSQTTLNATGSSDTYGLINSVLAPGYDVTETPDCGHTTFGEHIDEVFDTDLNDYAFRFHIHVDEDNDRCINFDRQRNEIKTYDKSPDNLLGVEGETVVYKWKFKLDADFQPSSSFTHLHQIKAVGGSEAGTPKITITARLGSPDKLELRFAETTSQTTLIKEDLDPFKGNWVDVEEIITYGEEIDGGSYQLIMKNMLTGVTLFSYSDDSIRMWNADADFMRPKWGIYRSLNDATNLRDEEVFFTGFSIEEIDGSLSLEENLLSETSGVYYDATNKELVFSEKAIKGNNKFMVYDLSGQLVFESKLTQYRFSVEGFTAGIYVVKLSNNSDSVKIIIE